MTQDRNLDPEQETLTRDSTVNKMLTPQQLETYQPRIDNGRRLRQLAHELETLSLDAMRTAEGWNS